MTHEEVFIMKHQDDFETTTFVVDHTCGRTHMSSKTVVDH